MTFIPVTDIRNFRPTQAIVGQEVELLADVIPTNATNRTIEWSLVSPSGGATFRRSGTRTWMTASASANITLRATIRNGAAG
jgi:uncharacterized protein YjdB